MIDWHRLLGIGLEDTFYNTVYKVETDVDVSKQKQELDITIIREAKGVYPKKKTLPDGLQDLNKYNLITFKSHQGTLNSFAIHEFIHHYIAYRKLVSPSASEKKLIKKDQFNLYGVSAHKPKQMLKIFNHKKIQQGIYELTHIDLPIKIIALIELPETPNNALWHMFAGEVGKYKYSVQNYQSKNPDISSILKTEVYKYYQKRTLNMSYTFADATRDFVKDNLDCLNTNEILSNYSSDEILKNYSTNEILKNYSSDEVLKNYSSDEILKNYSPDEMLRKCSSNERLQGLSKQDIEDFLKKMN